MSKQVKQTSQTLKRGGFFGADFFFIKSQKALNPIQMRSSSIFYFNMLLTYGWICHEGQQYHTYKHGVINLGIKEGYYQEERGEEKENRCSRKKIGSLPVQMVFKGKCGEGDVIRDVVNVVHDTP